MGVSLSEERSSSHAEGLAAAMAGAEATFIWSQAHTRTHSFISVSIQSTKLSVADMVREATVPAMRAGRLMSRLRLARWSMTRIPAISSTISQLRANAFSPQRAGAED